DKTVEIIEFNDRFQKPLDGGYRDLQLTVCVGSGLMCELQLNTKFFFFVKETSGHRAFEVKRQLAAALSHNDTDACLKTLKWAEDQPEATRAVLDERRSPLLHCAAANGNSDLVSLFLKYNADVNLTDQQTGRTALHEAMYHGRSCAAWALISAGACQNALDADGRLRQRVFPESEPVARRATSAKMRGVGCVCMLSQMLGVQELQRATKAFEEEVNRAFDGDEAKVLEKLREWKDPNSENENGQRPLHQALIKGHLKVARHLMLYKADLWERVNDQTAVSLALEHPDGLKLLIDTHPDGKNASDLASGSSNALFRAAKALKELLERSGEARAAGGKETLPGMKLLDARLWSRTLAMRTAWSLDMHPHKIWQGPMLKALL
ncbi:secG, partial [Symbiodinium pilosum]